MVRQTTQRPERRRARRVPTNRRAFFRNGSGHALLAEGTITDISGLGFQLRTQRRVATKDALQLEIYPGQTAGSGAPLLIDGTVARVSSRGGEFVVGVALAARYSAVCPPPERKPESPTPAANALPARTHEPMVQRRQEIPWRWLAACLLALLLLLPFGRPDDPALLNRASASTDDASSPEADPGAEIPYGVEEEVLEEPPVSPGNGDLIEPTVEFLMPYGPGREALRRPGASIREAEAMLVSGRIQPALDAFDRIVETAEPTAEAARAMLGRAQALAALGDEGAALAAADAVLRGPWPADTRTRAAAQRLEAVLFPDDGDSSHAASEILFASTSPGVSGSASRSGPRLYIDVDRAGHEAVLYEDGREVARYPVGLGRDNSTPLGRFTIANKISKPDWWNDGESVPYGDPRNPLGESWMGLGRGGSATPYGFHPTDESESIGHSTGEGCIRMLPDDAAELFRLCPTGTAVTIRP